MFFIFFFFPIFLSHHFNPIQNCSRNIQKNKTVQIIHNGSELKIKVYFSMDICWDFNVVEVFVALIIVELITNYLFLCIFQVKDELMLKIETG